MSPKTDRSPAWCCRFGELSDRGRRKILLRLREWSLSAHEDWRKSEPVVCASRRTEWYSTTKEGGVVVTVLAQTTCGHCVNFKPIMNSVQKEYGFKLYWFELDQVSSKSYTMLTNTYDIYSSFGTPYIFITNNGEFVADYQRGEMPKDELITFLKENGVIKSDSED